MREHAFNSGLMTPNKLFKILNEHLTKDKILSQIRNSTLKNEIIQKNYISEEDKIKLRECIINQNTAILEFGEFNDFFKRAVLVLKKSKNYSQNAEIFEEIITTIDSFLNKKYFFKKNIISILEEQEALVNSEKINIIKLKKTLREEENLSSDLFRKNSKKSFMIVFVMSFFVLNGQALAQCRDSEFKLGHGSDFVNFNSKIEEFKDDSSKYITLNNGINVFNLKERNNKFFSLIEEYFEMFGKTPLDLGIENILFTIEIRSKCNSGGFDEEWFEVGGLASYSTNTMLLTVPKIGNNKVSNSSLLYFISTMVHEGTHFWHEKTIQKNSKFNDSYGYDNENTILSRSKDKYYGSTNIKENVAETVSLVVDEQMRLRLETGVKITEIKLIFDSLLKKERMVGNSKRIEEKIKILIQSGFFPPTWKWG